MEDGAPAGNFAGRQLKLKQEQTHHIFPAISSAKGKELPTKKQHHRKKKHTTSHSSATCSASSQSSSVANWSESSSQFSAPSNCSPSPLSSLCTHCCPTPFSSCSNSTYGSHCCSRCPAPLSPCSKLSKKKTRRGSQKKKEGGISGSSGARKMTEITHPTSRIHTGRHFLDWHIPKDIIENKKSLPPVPMLKGLSPLHSPDKHEWINKLIDPGIRSLPLSPPYKPLVRDYPCPHADNLKETFRKYFFERKFKSSPLFFPSSKAPPPLPPDSTPRKEPFPFSSSGELKSLLLKHNDHFCQRKVEPLSGPMFTRCPGGGEWFVVHPEFRREPGMRMEPKWK